MKRVIGLGVIVVSLATAGAAQTPSFYTERLQRGLADYAHGQYAKAEMELRVAAFGVIDSVPDYELANVYLALTDQKLGKKSDAALAAEKVVRAEAITPAFDALQLDPQARSTFLADLPKLLTPKQLARAKRFAPLATSSTVARPAPKTEPRTEPRIETPPVVASPAATDAQRAAAAARNGNTAEARELALKALAENFTNALAHSVLGYLSWTKGDWNGVVEHYSVVRTRRRLTNEENAAFYVAMVRSGRLADASGVWRVLPVAVMHMPIVEEAAPHAEVTRSAKPPAAAATPSPTKSPERRSATATATTAPSTSIAAPVAVAPPQARPQPRGVSPLVAIARHEPSDAANEQEVAKGILEADRLLHAGKVAEARDAYLRLSEQPVNRDLALEIARGLNETSAFRASSAEYQKTYPLRRGEERHMFNEAVNRYEIGDFAMARKILAAALPALPKSREVELYRAKIERAK